MNSASSNFANIDPLLSGLGRLKFCGWQIAEKGDWKNTKKVSPGIRMDIIGSVITWLRTADKDIAIEALFAQDGGEQMFFGVRLEKEPKETQIKLLQQFFANVFMGDDFKTTIKKINVATKLSFLTGDPDLLEIGVFNLWKDVGSQIIFKKEGGGKLLSFEEISPSLTGEHPFPVMLEAAWREPYPHWIGIPVSEKSATGSHKLDRLRYMATVKAALK